MLHQLFPQHRAAPEPAPTECGYTLQTLIVTAVTVLLAALASTLLTAMASSSASDLAESPPDIAAKCRPWETFNPQLAAAEAGGGDPRITDNPLRSDLREHSASGPGGITSSGIGCLAPCYLTLNDGYDATIDLVLKPDNSHLNQPEHEFLALSRSWYDQPEPVVRGPEPGHLKYDASNRPPASPSRNQDGVFEMEVRLGLTYGRPYVHSADSGDPDITVASDPSDTLAGWIIPEVAGNYAFHTYQVGNENRVGRKYSADFTAWEMGMNEPPKLTDSQLAVRVAPGQACEIYHTATGEVLLDSRRR